MDDTVVRLGFLEAEDLEALVCRSAVDADGTLAGLPFTYADRDVPAGDPDHRAASLLARSATAVSEGMDSTALSLLLVAAVVHSTVHPDDPVTLPEGFPVASGRDTAGALLSTGSALMTVPGRRWMALPFMEEAAAMGEPEAMHSLGLMYSEGRWGVASDNDLARRWFTAASEHGHPDAERLRMLVERMSGPISIYSEDGYSGRNGGERSVYSRRNR